MTDRYIAAGLYSEVVVNRGSTVHASIIMRMYLIFILLIRLLIDVDLPLLHAHNTA